MKTKISEWSTTPASNTDIDGINIAEGCAPSGINDAIRDLMAQVRSWQSGASGDPFNGPMNGTIGATTAYSGAFTTVSATGVITSTLATGTAPLTIASTTKVTNLNADLLDGADWASPAALGSTTPAAVSATTLSASGAVTLSGGTANGVTYLNGSKVLTSGSALTFDGTNLSVNGSVKIPQAYALEGRNSANSGTAAWFGVAGRVDFGVAGDFAVIGGTSGVIFGNSATNSEQMRLTSTGLGIGTSSPAYKLDVNGSANITSYLRIGSTPATGGDIRLPNTGIIAGRNAANSSNRVMLQLDSSDSVLLQEGSVTINSAGNLGLGVTPSAWNTYPALEFASVGAIGYKGQYGNISANAYFSSGSWKYATSTGKAVLHQLDDGAFKWFTAASGTAGNAISFTQAMTLDASGNLGIGNTSPGELLVVGSSGRTTTYQSIRAGTVVGAFVADSTNSLYKVYTASNHPLVFGVNNNDYARIDTSGNLLVGTTSNTNSSRIFAIPSSNTSSAFACQGVTGDVSNPAAIFGKFDNNTTTSQILVRFTVNNNGAGSGQITANGANTAAFGSYSDERLKENIVDLAPQLSNIMALRPVEFDYIESEGGGHQTGFIAQNMESVYPDVVGEREDGMKMIAGWSKTEARLVKAIQEQQAIIDSLKARLDAANL